jgi:hypothetical protein
MPVHLGGTTYKLYFSNNRVMSGRSANPQADIKPVRLMYADGLEFDDWEGVEMAREVRFLWPDGSQLTGAEESRLDDFYFFLPGGDRNEQVMLTNMAAVAGRPPFIGTAVLLDP